MTNAPFFFRVFHPVGDLFPSTYVLAAILSQRLRGSLLDVRISLSNISNPWHFADKPASSTRPTAFSSQLHPRSRLVRVPHYGWVQTSIETERESFGRRGQGASRYADPVAELNG